MQSSKSTVLPLPVGAETTMFMSERKQPGKHSLCKELKYLKENAERKGAGKSATDLSEYESANDLIFTDHKLLMVINYTL